MKKSALLYKIATAIEDYYDTPEYKRGNCAESILKVIEDAGMLPPNVCGESIKTCGNFWEKE